VNPKDNLDAAMFSIRDEGLVSSFQRADYDTPAVAAPLAADLEVEKVGRTTGHTRGKVIGEMFGACGIPYSAALYGFSGIVSFEPVFTIAGHGGLFSDAGDSGSLITTIGQNGQRYAVGIVIGGRVDGSAAGGKTVRSAAKALLAEIRAPAGAVNTQGLIDAEGPFIKVMIDPTYGLVVSDVPSTFGGFRVVIERRELAFAH
jgi:hypothetical protein